MRLRGKRLFKCFLAFGTITFILFLLLNAIAKQHGSDDFVAKDQENSSAFLVNNFKSTRRLLNLTNFEFLIENNLCQGYNKELLAILIVTSYVGHDELRSTHRQAISQKKLSELGMQRVFLLAAIPQKEKFITQPQILNEQKRFGDLLQGNFVEDYRNLSYKHIMGLQWAATECSKAKFIIKIDDDIVYDIFQIKRYLDTLEFEDSKSLSSSALLAGYIFDSKPVIRNQANKWYVSQEEYAGKTYPSYISGWLYITNPATAIRLVEQSKKVPIFWIDDTWVTGLLREPLAIPLKRLNSWFSANTQYLHCCVRDLKSSNLECEFFVGPNGGDSKLLIEFLHNVEKCYYDECLKRNEKQILINTCVTSFKEILYQHGIPKVKPVKLR